MLLKVSAPVSESVIIYPIPNVEFSAILANSYFKIDAKHGLPGMLQTNLSTMLGKGAFKTVYAGNLTLYHRTDSGLGTTRGEEVVVKRMFFSAPKPKGKGSTFGVVDPDNVNLILKRYMPADELVKITTEATLLYVATSLLGLVYAFIDRYEEENGPPSFDIPRLRFIHGGVAITHAALGKDALPSSSATTMRSVSLLEERIHQDGNDENVFLKYIHNTSGKPLLRSDDSRWEIQQFLCFCQHVQYVKSQGLVYTSDFQGMSPFHIALDIWLKSHRYCRAVKRSTDYDPSVCACA